MSVLLRFFVVSASFIVLLDALIAFYEFDHMGDMHISWGFNSLCFAIFLFTAALQRKTHS